MVERSNELFSVICETYKTKWQTESRQMKEDLVLHLMVQCYHLGLSFFEKIPSPRKTKSRLHQFGTKMLHRLRAEFWRTGTTSRTVSRIGKRNDALFFLARMDHYNKKVLCQIILNVQYKVLLESPTRAETLIRPRPRDTSCKIQENVSTKMKMNVTVSKLSQKIGLDSGSLQSLSYVHETSHISS